MYGRFASVSDSDGTGAGTSAAGIVAGLGIGAPGSDWTRPDRVARVNLTPGQAKIVTSLKSMG